MPATPTRFDNTSPTGAEPITAAAAGQRGARRLPFLAALVTVALCALGLLVGASAGTAVAMSSAVAAESVVLGDVAATPATPAPRAARSERRARRLDRIGSRLGRLRRRPLGFWVMPTAVLAVRGTPRRGPPDLTD